jgi:hypothetical protein
MENKKGYLEIGGKFYPTLEHTLTLDVSDDGENMTEKRILSIDGVTTGNAQWEQIEAAIHAEYRYRCGCDHDCCGHWQESVTQMWRDSVGRDGQTWIFEVNKYRNI